MFDFLALRKTLKGFGTELVNVRKDIELSQRQIEDVQFAPACFSDVIEALSRWAKRNEQKYIAYLNPIFEGLARDAARVQDDQLFAEHLRIQTILPKEDYHFPMPRDVQLCGLMGAERFVDLMRPHLESLNWSNAGMPLRDRPTAIEKLQEKLRKLEKRERELIAAAADAGIGVE